MIEVHAWLAFEAPLPVMALGAIVGLTYGLLAVGMVLVFRANRIINFAHGDIGVFAAIVFGVAVTRWHLPYYAAMPLALALGGAVGAISEIGVVRRLRSAPALMSIVATLGVGQLLVFIGTAFTAQQTSTGYPQPPGVPVFDIGALRVTPAYSGMLFLSPAVVVGLAVFLRRSRFGIRMRASAANPEAARMAGIFANRMSSLTWAIAGALSTFTAILVLPTSGFTGSSFGPGLLLRALTGAVFARMVSLPVALASGLGIGVLEQLLLWNYPRAGFVDVALFGAILVGLLLQPTVTTRGDAKGSWAAVAGWRPIPAELRGAWPVRHLGALVAVAGFAVACVLPAVLTNSAAIVMVGIIGFAIVGLSVGLITGLGGQLSLGQFALAGIGAVVSYQVERRTGSFVLAFVYAGLAAAGASLVIGLPALRIRGLMLTVTTLSFSLVTPNWLLQQSWALGDGVAPGRPSVLGNELDTGRSYYLFALGVLAVILMLTGNVRRSGFGRLLVAVRDNEDNARAFTVRARVVKVQAFLLAGFVAGVGGAVYGHTFSSISAAVFQPRSSINVVAMAVIGGISIMAGPLLGAIYVIGIPAFLPLDAAGLAATQLGWLILVLYLPGGLAQVLQPLRDRVVRWLAPRSRRGGDASPPTGETPKVSPSAIATITAPSGSVPRAVRGEILRATGLCKRYGGVTAVDDVSFTVRRGEILGLIGPNGAGKTSTFEILGGFTRPEVGSIVYDHEEISGLSPEARARRGLVRSFQDAALFPTMSVLDCVILAQERVLPTSLAHSILGVPLADRRRRANAEALIEVMGLHDYRDRQVRELSTGTRRIVEIACLVALRPRALLLDEPSSGIAQRETEALGRMLAELRDALDLTMIVIEHDIPLITGLSHRMIAMDAGRIIAVGTPSEIRQHPAVVDAYLGGSIEVIERSDGIGAVGAVGTRRRAEALRAPDTDQ